MFYCKPMTFRFYFLKNEQIIYLFYLVNYNLYFYNYGPSSPDSLYNYGII